MFKKADEILLHSVKGITDLIMMPGLVNLDFADIKTTMSRAGMAIMGIGMATGENRAVDAASKAISHPLLEDISITGASGVLMNITSSSDLTMEEMNDASERIYQEVGDEADIIWGTVIDDAMGEELRVTVIATGIGGTTPKERLDFDLKKRTKEIKDEVAVNGKVRPLTQADIERISSRKKGVKSGEDEIGVQRLPDGRRINYKGMVDDQEDLEIPTFLRRGAD